MIKVYNSLTRQKDVLTPLVPGKLGLYVCGITVYDHCHLGHARSMVCFDVIVRFLREEGYDVTFVRNITDIDDKIIKRALERSVTIDALTAEYIHVMHADAHALNCLPPTLEPRATTSIDAIVRLITRLLDREYAYLSDEGDVCYEVSRFEEYGKLSNKDPDGLLAGARVDIVKGKRSPLDFVLWKRAKPDEPSWESPWGLGRPGWHIECSAMAMEALGEQFDIHGGGLDLQFPHHENEIAQSEGATGKPFANYWLHVGLLQFNHEKMAKSTGNFLTIADALKKHHPEVIRYFLLSSHYRSALNYSEENILLAQKALTRLYQSMRDVSLEGAIDETWLRTFNDAMQDDFNTPVALSILFDLSHAINKTGQRALATTLKHLGGVLGVLQENPTTFLQSGTSETAMDIDALVEARWQARSQREWAKADEIRARLFAQGIDVEDGPDGSTWRVIV